MDAGHRFGRGIDRRGGGTTINHFTRLCCLLVLALLGLAATGCGGGSSGSSSTTATGGAALTKQEFVTRVNGYCAETRRRILGPLLSAYRREQQRETQQGRQPRSAASFFRDTVAPEIRRLIARIRALPPPAGDEQQVKAILDAAGSTVRALETNASSVVRVGPPFDVELPSRTLDRAKLLALRYGLKQCGSSKGS